MLKKLSFLLPALFSLNTFVAAMELPEQKQYKIICADQEELILDQFGVDRFGLIKNMLAASKGEIPTPIELPTERNISASDLKLLLELDDKKLARQIQSITTENLNKLIHKAEFLELPDTQTRKLVILLRARFNSFHELIAFEKETIHPAIRIKDQTLTINLALLENLDGIEEILSFTGNQNKWFNKNGIITKLRLSDNHLKSVDLEKVFQLFPYLQSIELQNNFITTMIAPKKRPSQDCIIDLTNNPITNNATHFAIIEKQCKELPVSFKEKIKDTINSDLFLPRLSWGLIALCICQEGLFLVPPLLKAICYAQVVQGSRSSWLKSALFLSMFNQMDLQAIAPAAVTCTSGLAYTVGLGVWIGNNHSEPEIIFKNTTPPVTAQTLVSSFIHLQQSING